MKRWVALIALAWSGAAMAHEGNGAAGGFIAGFSHPLTGLDHLLAMVSVGIWGAILGRPLLVALPVVFPAMMAVGGLLGIAAVPFPPVEIGVALSVVILGIAIATAWRAPVWLAVMLVGGFALFHGYAHGRELPAAADPLYYSVGFMFATGLLHLAGIGVGLLHNHRGGRPIARTIGALVAACGSWFLWQALS